MPGDTRPHKACLEKKRRRIRKLGTLEDAQRKLWQAITNAEDVLLDDQVSNETCLKAVHAITQATTAYAKLVEAGELEARLAEIEKTIDERSHSMRRVG